MTSISNKALERLAQLATDLFFLNAKKAEAESLKSSLAKAIRRSLRLLPEAEADQAVAKLEFFTAKQRPPPVAKRTLLRQAGTAGLLYWARRNRPSSAPKMSTDELGRQIVEWLLKQPPKLGQELLEAGLRRVASGAQPNSGFISKLAGRDVVRHGGTNGNNDNIHF